MSPIAPQIPILKFLAPSVIVFADRAFRRWLGLEEVPRVAPHDVLITRGRETRAGGLTCAFFKTQWEGGCLQTRKRALTRKWILILDVQPPGMWEIKICCLSHPVYGMLFGQSELIKTMFADLRDTKSVLWLSLDHSQASRETDLISKGGFIYPKGWV